MNGRVQNPLWGRMLSPDPVLADLELPQGLNPYSYVGNNPGSWTDPTGFAWCENYNCTVYGWPGPSLYWAPSLPDTGMAPCPDWPSAIRFWWAGQASRWTGRSRTSGRMRRRTGRRNQYSAARIGFISGFVGGALGGGAALTELGPGATESVRKRGSREELVGLIGTNTVGTERPSAQFGLCEYQCVTTFTRPAPELRVRWAVLPVALLRTAGDAMGVPAGQPITTGGGALAVRYLVRLHQKIERSSLVGLCPGLRRRRHRSSQWRNTAASGYRPARLLWVLRMNSRVILLTIRVAAGVAAAFTIEYASDI